MATPRLLTLNDAVEAAALIRMAFAELAGRIDPPSGALAETATSVAESIASGGGAGIECAGRLVACILWREVAGGLYFGRLAVHPQARRHGHAKSLVAAAEAETRRRCLPRTHLGVRLGLTENRALFARCGYLEVRQTAHPGYTAPTSVDMEKRLT